MARERTLRVNIVGDTKSLNAALGHSSTRLSKLGKVAGVAGGAVGAGLGFAVKSAMGFEKQLSSLGAVSDATAKQMEMFRKQALKAGADTAFSAKEAAVAQTELAKGGLSVANIMGGGLDSALALAAAGELELGEAAATTANAMNLFGLSGKDSIKVADALATAANATTADVSDFGMALKAGGAVAKSAGLSFQETVVALEALAASGVKNSDAGTSLKTALIQLIKPTDKQAEAAKKANLEFIDQQGNMKSLGDISTMLRDKLGGQTAAQRTATLATIAGTDGVRTLTALYDAGPAKLDKWRKGVDESGTAADVAKKKQDNLAGAIEQFGGSAETLGIIVGTALIPALTDATQWLTGFLNEMQDGTGTGGTFVRIMETIGTAIYDVGKFVVDSRREIVSLVAAFGTYKVLMLFAAGLRAVRSGTVGLMIVSKLVPAFWALNAALTANPIGLVVVGLAALAGGLVYAYTKSKTFREVVGASFSAVRKIAADTFDVLTFGLRQYLVGIGKIAGAVSKVPGMGWLKGVSNAALGAAAKLKDIGDAIRGIPDEKKIKITASTIVIDGQRLTVPSGPANRNAGGIIPGTGNTDTVPAMLTPGEFVIRKQVVEKFGPTFFSAINAGQRPAGFAVGGRVQGLNPPFLRALNSLSSDTGIGINVTSGRRTRAEQTALWNASDKSGKWVAPPGTSKHETGDAADIAPQRGAFSTGALSNNSLYFPMSWEPWHIQLAGGGGRSSSSGGGGASAPAAPAGPSPSELRAKRKERAERAGSRAVNRIASKFSGAIRAATSQASGLGTAIEDADTAYGQSERAFGQSDENLGTAAGRGARLSELAALTEQKRKQVARMRKRATALRRAISKLEALLKQGRAARNKAKGSKRAKINERLRAYEDRLSELKAELKALGVSIKDTELDIGDLAKEAGEVAGTADDAPPDPTDAVGQALSDIDLQERAGVLSADQARAAKVAVLTAALGSGTLDQRQQWEVMAQLRDVQEQATAAVNDLASALRDVKASIDAQLAFANGVSAITSMEAVRMMSDVISGQIGNGVSQRGRMPGSGALSRI